MQEYTFSMLKPNVISEKLVGKVIQYFEVAGLTIVASKMMVFSEHQAQTFYQEHKEKSFFSDLVQYITSGPVILQVLKGEDVISQHRQIIGHTDPKQADKGTIRGDLGKSIDANLVHGSDSKQSAQREITMFFKDDEIHKVV